MRVRHGFDLVHVGAQRAGEQHLAVAGGAAARHFQLAAGIGVAAVQRAQGVHGNVHGLALVGGVERVYQAAVFAEQRELRGGASAVDAQVHGELFGQIPLVNKVLRLGKRMALLEAASLFLVGEEGLAGVFALRCPLAAGGVHHHDVAGLERGDRRGRRKLRLLVGEQPLQGKRGAHGDDGLGVLGDYDVLPAQLQALGEHLDKAGVEGERAALEHDGRLDFQALRQTADGLLGNGVEAGKRDVLLRHTLVQQRLDVGFRVHAAAARDGVHRLALFGQVVELLGGDLQQGADLVDERAGAAGAAAVHAHVGNVQRFRLAVELEEDHLRVLAAQLDGGARGGVECAYGKRVRHHFLHVGKPQRLCQRRAARPAQRRAHGCFAELLLQLFQQPLQAGGLLGMVAHVAAHKHLVGACFHHGDLGGGRTHVDADEQLCGSGGVVRESSSGWAHAFFPS